MCHTCICMHIHIHIHLGRIRQIDEHHLLAAACSLSVLEFLIQHNCAYESTFMQKICTLLA